MPYASIQERVTGLLTRQVAVSDATGVSRPDLESASILESVATTLLVHPRSALYFAHLARNRLARLLKDEIEIIGKLTDTIQNFSNVSFAIKDLTSLEKAKTALIQIEAQDALDSGGEAYRRFEASISGFLESQLARNVRSGGKLMQPGAEARLELPAYYNALKSAHGYVLDGFYALLTGVENFIESPFGTTLGLTATSRARNEIEDIISTLTADDSASTSRDIAYRLISAKAALRVLGSKPSVHQPIISLADGISARVKIESTELKLQPPFTISSGFSMGIGTSLDGLLLGGFPLLSPDIAGLPLIVAKTAQPGPFLCPPEGCFFVEITNATSGGTMTQTVNLNPGGIGAGIYRTWAEIQLAVNTAFAFMGITMGLVQGHVAVWCTHDYEYSHITIRSTGDEAGQVSIHEALGFEEGQTGGRGVLTTDVLIQLLRLTYPDFTFFADTDGSVLVSTPEAHLAVALSLYPRWGLTASTLVTGTGDTVELYNSDGIVNPLDFLSPGDFLVLGNVEARVAKVYSDKVALTATTPYYDGPLTATSALSAMWLELDSLLHVAYESLKKTPYARNLNRIDHDIAALYGASTPAQQQDAISKLNELLTLLQNLLLTVEDPATLLSMGAASQERAIVNGIIATLEEKKYDRALDLLLKCRIQEVFALDWQTVSFGGTLMKAMSSVARNDFVYPNRMKDETNTPATQKDVF